MPKLGFLILYVDFLADAGLLTGEIAEVEDTCTTHFTTLVDLDAVNERGLVRENSLNTHATGDFANREGLGERIHAANLNDYTAELLESFFITFLDSVGNGDGVTGLEIGIGGYFLVIESLLCNLN